MQRTMMKSKIHRATVTGANLDYVGSITLDRELMELADIREFEQVARARHRQRRPLRDVRDGGRPGRRHPQRRRGPARAARRPRHRHHVRRLRRGRARRRTRRGSCTSTRRTGRSTRTRRCSAPARTSSGCATIRTRPPRLTLVIDVLVLGSGVAGLTTALHAARRGLSVLVLTKGELSHSATRYAQGGVAAALAAPDSPELHLADTLTAGAGLCDADAVRVLVTEGPDRVRELAALGAHFDTEPSPDGARAAARPRGRSLARAGRARGRRRDRRRDRARARRGRRTSATRSRSARAGSRSSCSSSATAARACSRCAPTARSSSSAPPTSCSRPAASGQCFAVTTNPTLSTGDGIALALKAGVACADLEFVQFHPTALHHPAMPRPLLSEALRGEGAVLRDADGVAFMTGVHPLADLAPRDVVAARDPRADAARPAPSTSGSTRR